MDKYYRENPVDPEDYSYTDPEFTDEDDLPEDFLEESSEKSNGQRKKSAERIDKEQRFTDLYNEFMHPTKTLSAFRKQCQLDDLYTLLLQLNRGWANGKAARYAAAGFTRANGEDALSIGCYYAYTRLLEDKAAGHYVEYPVARYLRLAQNKAIDDYFRKEFGRLQSKKKDNDPNNPNPLPEDPEQDKPRRRKEPSFISIDAMDQDDHGNYHSDRNIQLSYNPFDHLRRPEFERGAMASRLYHKYISELLNYPGEPQKPLAVMYGNLMFQIAKIRGRDSLSQMAQKTTKVSSPAWAHARMGSRTLRELGTFSENTLSKFFNNPLRWGPAFQTRMHERGEDGITMKWADIVYTAAYTERQTADWIESISKSTIQKCAREFVRDADMMEYLEETFSCREKIRKALTKIEKEAGR